jgi:spore coat polysaccharide biosynthesis protein SpsF
VEKMNVIAILQARVSSTRLPGKEVIVATSDVPSDDPLVSVLKKTSTDVYRGSLDNVLDRFYNAATLYMSEHVVRITGDCPLIDPVIVDEIVEMHLQQGNDYTSNCVKATFPDGLDVEVVSYSALKEVKENAKLPSELEHVTPYIRNNPQNFKISHMKNDSDLSAMRWTVDEPEDLEFVESVYNRLYPKNPNFVMKDILDLLDKEPELQEINSEFERNSGINNSLNKDKKYLDKKI